MDNTRLILRSSYLGMFVQAIAINLPPVLFIALREELGLTFEQIGRLILVNFSTQVAIELIVGPIVDRVGVKPFVIAANVLACAGLWLFAILPSVTGSPYTGLLIGTAAYSVGIGVLDIILSPIVNSLPSDRKESAMSLLHSFYAWGQAGVILLTTLAIFLFGRDRWQVITIAWSAVPAVTAVGFALARLGPVVDEGRRTRLRHFVFKPVFIAMVLAMAMAGATELAISQWTSAFAERGLGLPKIVGDLGGVCLFAIMIGVGRLWFGTSGRSASLHRLMIGCAWLSVAAYLTASLSPWPAVSLIACVTAGLGVSLLWPGTISLAAGRFPLAGASMFALLSAGGNLGGAVSAWAVGVVADLAHTWNRLPEALFGQGLDAEQLGLRTGLFAATLCPVILLALLYSLRAGKAKEVIPLEPGLPAQADGVEIEPEDVSPAPK